MKIEITRLYSTFYIIPAIKIWHETYLDSDDNDKFFKRFCRLSLELTWFNQSLDFVFIDR